MLYVKFPAVSPTVLRWNAPRLNVESIIGYPLFDTPDPGKRRLPFVVFSPTCVVGDCPPRRDVAGNLYYFNRQFTCIPNDEVDGYIIYARPLPRGYMIKTWCGPYAYQIGLLAVVVPSITHEYCEC